MARKSENILLGESFIHSSKKQCGLNIGQQDVNNTITMNLTNLPLELLKKILGYHSFGNISKLRLVSKCFDHICSDLLNTEFDRQKAMVLQRHNYLKIQMPRRASSCREHPLFREHNMIAIMHVRLNLLNLTIGKYVKNNHGCFFAGEILDEVNRVVSNFRRNAFDPSCNIADEIFDLSTMAVEYFTEHIEPVLQRRLCISESSEKSIHSTAKVNSSFLKVADKMPKQKPPEKIDGVSLKELEKSLRQTTRLVYKNTKDIKSLKLSSKSFKKEITTLENTIYQIKQNLKEYKGIPEQEKGNEEIAVPKDNMDVFELSKKLICLNERIDSCEAQLFKCQQSEPKTITKNSITGIDSEACAEVSETKHSLENLKNEKICYGSEISVSSTNLSSTTVQNKEEKIKVASVPFLVSTSCSLKRKCKIIPSKVLSKKKKQN